MLPGPRRPSPTLHDSALSRWPHSLASLPTSPWPRIGKRPFDFIVGLFLLFIALPVLILAMLLVAAEGRPIFCVHQRVGRGGRLFGCLKFRTTLFDDWEPQARSTTVAEMRCERESPHKPRRKPRVTPLGRFLRQYNLDELPQLLNVLRGEMSLIGPRPLVASELARIYGGVATAYLLVRPGIIGPWQVNCRGAFDDKRLIALDIACAINHSFRGDLATLGRTISAVLSGREAH